MMQTMTSITLSEPRKCCDAHERTFCKIEALARVIHHQFWQFRDNSRFGSNPAFTLHIIFICRKYEGLGSRLLFRWHTLRNISCVCLGTYTLLRVSASGGRSNARLRARASTSGQTAHRTYQKTRLQRGSGADSFWARLIILEHSAPASAFVFSELRRPLVCLAV